MSTMQQRFASVVSAALNEPAIAGPTREIRKMLKGIMPMIKLSFGKEVADSCRTLLGDNPTPEMVYRSFHCHLLDETTLRAIARTINQRMDYVLDGDTDSADS